jgi:hypothetical protein
MNAGIGIVAQTPTISPRLDDLAARIGDDAVGLTSRTGVPTRKRSMPPPRKQVGPRLTILTRVGIRSALTILFLLTTPSWSAGATPAPHPGHQGSSRLLSGQYTTEKPAQRPSPPPYWSRFPVTLPRGRRLRVLFYARYSTDEQNPRSIEDQVAYCRRFLESFGLADTDPEITVLCDREISGERIFRPGIDQVREGIDGRRWDLILAEGASRLFRDVAACLDLVRLAVDNGIRVICINDEVDTADEDNWEDRLSASMAAMAFSKQV